MNLTERGLSILKGETNDPYLFEAEAKGLDIRTPLLRAEPRNRRKGGMISLRNERDERNAAQSGRRKESREEVVRRVTCDWLGIASNEGYRCERRNYDRKREEESEGLPVEMCRDRRPSSTADLPAEAL